MFESTREEEGADIGKKERRSLAGSCLVREEMSWRVWEMVLLLFPSSRSDFDS